MTTYLLTLNNYWIKNILIILAMIVSGLSVTIAHAQTFSIQSPATFPSPAILLRSIQADFDSDGDADVLYQTSANGSAFEFARSNGNGSFTILGQAASPFAGLALPDFLFSSTYRASDFDGDGDIDLWASVANATGSYFRNDGTSFSAQSSSTFPAPAAVARSVQGDFDNDRDLDILYQTGANGTAWQYARNNGNGTFTIVAQAASPFAGLALPDFGIDGMYRVADFDGDRDVDVWASVANATGSYFRNDAGVFSAQSSATFPAPAAIARSVGGDFDTDGDFDILYQTGADGTPFQYARNNGNGTFTIVSQAASPFAGLTLLNFISVRQYRPGDFDGDGDVDLWYTVNNSTGTYFMQDGSPPDIISSSPANNATNVSVFSNISLTFNKAVVKGTGSIFIVKVSDNSIVETINVAGAQVTGSGTTWTIDPSVTLAVNTQYAVKADAGTFRDAGSSVVFSGIINNTTLSFTTYSVVLPVQWLSFNTTVSNGTVILNWNTTEVNTDHYEVERSSDGRTFTVVNKLPSKNASLNSYSFKDEQLETDGTYYYRIKLVDKDGSISYSEIKIVQLTGRANEYLQLKGNPFSSQLVFKVATLQRTKATITIADLNGKIVFSENMALAEGTNVITLPAGFLAKGQYLLTVYTATNSLKAKVIKM